MTGISVKDAARRERNRVRVARDRLLQAAKKQKVAVERGPLEELASRLWPNRPGWTEKIVGRALIDDEDLVGGVVMKTEAEDGATPDRGSSDPQTTADPESKDYGQRELEKAADEEARRPSDDVLEEIVAFCHELLRGDHTLEWKVAWAKVRDRWPGFTDEKYFIRSPWRRAKVAERKERTGSGLTRETRERDGPRDSRGGRRNPSSSSTSRCGCSSPGSSTGPRASPTRTWIDRTPGGDRLTKTAQVRMVGNSVCPPIAAALVRANVPSLIAREEAREGWAA